MINAASFPPGLSGAGTARLVSFRDLNAVDATRARPASMGWGSSAAPLRMCRRWVDNVLTAETLNL